MRVNTGPYLRSAEAARRLGVSAKALRLYEAHGLVRAERTAAGWRVYGPDEIRRLHQVIALTSFGFPLSRIAELLAGGLSDLAVFLELHEQVLRQEAKRVDEALRLLAAARARLARQGGLSADELMNLTRETLMPQPTDTQKFAARFETLIAEQDPTGQASRAFDEVKQDAIETIGDIDKARLQALVEEATRLKETGDVESEAAKAFVRTMRARTAGIRRPAEAELIRDAYAKAVADAQAKSAPFPLDPAVFEFFGRVARGMKERGELD